MQKPSGWRSHALGLLNAIQDKVEPVLCTSEIDYAETRRMFPNCQILMIPTTQRSSAGSLSGLLDLWRCYRASQTLRIPAVDLVHSLEAYPTGLVGSWLARRVVAPHILTSHGTYGVIWRDHALDKRLYERVLIEAQLICPVSHGSAEMMRASFGSALRNTPIQVILNGNDAWKRVPQSTALKRRPADKLTLISVGDVKPRKGYHVSLEAFAIAKSSLPNARYMIVGQYKENAYYNRLQKIIQRERLSDVSFLGTLSDDALGRCYQEASAFILTPQQDGAHFEGFGLVYVEAGAYGLPVIATRTGGVPDAVQDRVTGFLAEPQDIDELANAILRLLTDDELARNMGKANRQRAETLTWERNAASQYKAYQEVLAG